MIYRMVDIFRVNAGVWGAVHCDTEPKGEKSE